MNYYNEIDPHAAAWLRGLISEGLIPMGDVDERSIRDVLPTELSGYTQCHFFAGIGGWSLALQLAGWPPSRPVWTGSCPCPPFSSAGKKKHCPQCGGKPIPHPLQTGIFACVPCGHEWLADERHLYPEFYRLIRECRPPVIFGEQVAGADGLVWLSGVSATLEAACYAFGALDLSPAGSTAPHIRQRLYWVGERLADTGRSSDECRSGSSEAHGEAGGSKGSARQRQRRGPDVGNRLPVGGMAEPSLFGGEAGLSESIQREEGQPGVTNDRCYQQSCRVADADGGSRAQHEREPGNGSRREAGTHDSAERGGDHGRLANADGHGRKERHEATEATRHGHSVNPDGQWADAYWLECRDGKYRRVPTEPALFPLADGLPYKLARRGSVRPALLKGAGNAIVPQVAAEFISAFLDVITQGAH